MQIYSRVQTTVKQFVKGIGSGSGQTPFLDVGQMASRIPAEVAERLRGEVPLSWAATISEGQRANLGDALSPVVVGALSGLPIAHTAFQTSQERMAAVGTIGQDLAGGTVHLWGTGLSPFRYLGRRRRYRLPPDTKFHIHAMRGPWSMWTMERLGVETPKVYGDPVWFLPAIMPPAQEKRYELGVIPHFAELPKRRGKRTKAQERYGIPKSLQADVKLISTLTEPTLEGLEEAIKQITSCRRIVSNSLHGLLIAETYGIPCLHFPHGEQEQGGAVRVPMSRGNEAINYRFRDFFAGIGVKRRFVYQQNRNQRTNWLHVIRTVDRRWEPVEWDASSFLEAFPLPLAFNPLAGEPFEGRSLLTQIKF